MSFIDAPCFKLSIIFTFLTFILSLFFVPSLLGRCKQKQRGLRGLLCFTMLPSVYYLSTKLAFCIVSRIINTLIIVQMETNDIALCWTLASTVSWCASTLRLTHWDELWQSCFSSSMVLWNNLPHVLRSDTWHLARYFHEDTNCFFLKLPADPQHICFVL